MIGTLGKTKQCICGKWFVVGNAQYGFRRKYCSDKCIKTRWRKDNLEQHNIYNKGWRDRNKEYYVKYRKEKLNKYKDKSLIPWTMQAKSNIAKGKLLESWVVERLKLSGLDKRASRTPGSGNGLMKGDVWNDLNLCIEAKNQKNFSQEWAKQAKRESMGTQTPVVVWHPPQVPLEDSVVIIQWCYFEELLLKSKDPELKQPDRAVAWKVKSAVNSLRALLKELE